jgi:hypothetical protein
VNWSVLVIVALLAYGLAAGHFRAAAPGRPVAEYVAAAVVTAVALSWCAECREELAGLAALPGRLGSVPATDVTMLVPDDAWIATPHRDALTSSEVHQAVTYRPITRYEVTGGYLNLPGLTACDPSRTPAATPEETS